jgi:two-component system, sensor histidine kinase LadS
VDQHVFNGKEIEYLEDPSLNLDIAEVANSPLSNQFIATTSFSPPYNYNHSSAYWYRIRIRHNAGSRKDWKIEFFDQTIDEIEFYLPEVDKSFTSIILGDTKPFGARHINHKNFVIDLPKQSNDIVTYYFRIYSQQQADVLIVLRAETYFFSYALKEYLFFGVFYGMILIFGFYNLLMFVAVQERHYLYYVLYLAGICAYEMSADGVGFQFVWPENILINQYAVGFSLYFASTFSLLFTGSLLNLRKQHPVLLKILILAFLLRTVVLIMGLSIVPQWFNYRFIDIIPFIAAFFSGIYCLLKKYRPARFLVVGYAFLFIGIVIKFIQYMGFAWLPLGGLTHYSLGFAFIMEMMFLSFAISDKIKLLRVEQQKAQQAVIDQLHENQKLKDTLNQNLEERVNIKTYELQVKSQLIHEQNVQLAEVNLQLKSQAEEIAQMNALLKRDNLQLKHDVEIVTEARILSKEVDFQEFSIIYPDDNACLKFLSEIKWNDGFTCEKCQYSNYCDGRTPFSRRCTRCGYEESATAYTILHNTRIPIVKSFYMIFLVYSSKGLISSHKLSELLNIRQSTCWLFASKVKKAMKGKHKSHNENVDGWHSILLQ